MKGLQLGPISCNTFCYPFLFFLACQKQLESWQLANGQLVCMYIVPNGSKNHEPSNKKPSYFGDKGKVGARGKGS
jgi:hypothetical protein